LRARHAQFLDRLLTLSATRQLVPLGWLTMMVQVEPLSLVSTSTSTPLLARPTATGVSL